MIYVKSLEQSEHDLDFLTDMMYEAIHIPENKPPKEELLNLPHIKKYSEGWGRKGDRAIMTLRIIFLLVLHGIAYLQKIKKAMDMLMIRLLNWV
ncbi:hypothetical protein [Peribacillus frigoritolerans]|uniref:hypothetical protein n=1 Tax=Peribacillus frigoritolerans TaxID=450367 RepID=UPI001CEF77F0|nr:hypothetical protein [Peribacillus frigoritolerans]